jgi:hypothetical protein
MRAWIALEVDFLLSLQLGEENSAAAIDAITRFGGFPLATPSVLQELADQAKNGKDEALRLVAEKTLKSMATWHVLMPSLEWKDNALADAAAKKLLERGLCSSYQRALILSEAAVSDCPFLLTYNPAVGAVDPAALKLFFVENHLPDCFAMPPHLFVHYFSRPKAE